MSQTYEGTETLQIEALEFIYEDEECEFQWNTKVALLKIPNIHHFQVWTSKHSL